MSPTFKMAVKYQKNLPSIKELAKVSGGKNFILIFDEKLSGRHDFTVWSSAFSHKFSLLAGEKLKNLDGLSAHIKKILPAMAGFAPHENVIVAVGGGSVGDFAGFIASIIKRGVGYVQIPSTWLAAVDSAHGGKTAMNVDDFKNQVGTFYAPKMVYCVRALLDSQPDENIRSAYGEVLKMALLTGGSLFARLQKLKQFDSKNLWALLPLAVKSKYVIVAKDPFETKGLRHILNLGHTVGHAFELENFMPHGHAVQLGLEFAAEWSHRQKILNSKDYENVKKLFAKNKVSREQPLRAERFHLRLKQDKKSVKGDQVRFIFIQKPGRPFIKEVKIADLVQVAREMGWAQ